MLLLLVLRRLGLQGRRDVLLLQEVEEVYKDVVMFYRCK